MSQEANKVWNIPPKHEETRDHYYKEIVSFSHLIGMISSNVISYIKSAYKKDFFKTTWNSLEEPFSQRSKGFRDSMSKPKPSMYIIPKFDPSVESEFVPQSEFDAYIANDPESDIKIGMFDAGELVRYSNFRLFAKARRYKMDFDLKFIFDSDVQRIQAQEYMRQSIRHKIPIVLYTYLENVIPTNYMMSIAKINNMDYKSEEFLKFINMLSDIPITRRLRTGSGNMEFFAMVRSPLEMRFPDGPTTEGPAKKGNLTVSSAFSDYVSVEFVAYSTYFLVMNEEPGEILYKDNTNTIKTDGSMDTVGVDKLFLIEVPDTKYLENECVRIVEITVQPDHNGDNTINLLNDGVINDNTLINAIFAKFNKKENVDFLHTLIFEELEELDGGRVLLNKKNLDLTIKNMDIYKTYHIYIYLDKKKVNKEILDIFVPDDMDKIK